MDDKLSYGDYYKFNPATSVENGVGMEVLPDLNSHTVHIVNFCLVKGGMTFKMSFMFPIKPINLGNYVKPLPEDESVPHSPEFKWIHTP